jgi:hypothetical protein
MNEKRAQEIWRKYRGSSTNCGFDAIREIVAAEVEEAVSGMHVQKCRCHNSLRTLEHERAEWSFEGHSHPFTDPSCIAAREKATKRGDAK